MDFLKEMTDIIDGAVDKVEKERKALDAEYDRITREVFDDLDSVDILDRTAQSYAYSIGKCLSNSDILTFENYLDMTEEITNLVMDKHQVRCETYSDDLRDGMEEARCNAN